MIINFHGCYTHLTLTVVKMKKFSNVGPLWEKTTRSIFKKIIVEGYKAVASLNTKMIASVFELFVVVVIVFLH